jgi:DNA-binding GntR family transcriptional regulator
LPRRVVAKEGAEDARRWREAGTASLHFHQTLVQVLGSHRLDEFCRTLLAQLRLAWGASWSEEEFQRGWAVRDRELFELLRRGHRTQTVGVLLVYLEDSERQVLDGLRMTHAVVNNNETNSETYPVGDVSQDSRHEK